MKKNKDSNNLDYIENPTMEYKEVIYKESEEQQTFNDRAENYYDEKDIYNEAKEPYDESEENNAKEEIYDNKEVARVKRIKLYSNPFYIPVFLYYFWPLGLYWMWKYKVYNKTARIIISIVMPVFGTMRIIGRFNR